MPPVTFSGTASPVPQGNRWLDRVDKRRLYWVGAAILTAVQVALLASAARVLFGRPVQLDWILAGVLLVMLASAAVAGRFPRLLELSDRVLVRMLVWTGLVAVMVTIYLLVVVGFAHRPRPEERAVLLLSLMASGAGVALYRPARAWLLSSAMSLVYGNQRPPEETLRRFSLSMTRSIPLEELLLQLAESLRSTFTLARVEIWTGADGRFDLTVSLPRRRGAPEVVLDEREAAVVTRTGVSGGSWLEVWLPELVHGRDSSVIRVAPLAHSGQLLGLLVCQRLSDAPLFTEDDDAVLAQLARQLAVALHNVRLDNALQASLDELQDKATELQRSRARIVAAGDAERRKLERDLHDGAQQHLVAIAVKTRLVRNALAADPMDAAALIEELGADIKEAVEALRALAHGIFPPLLASGGLSEALAAAASRAALPTWVEVSTPARYPANLESAVYFCCLEALQNAAKHAGPDARAQVRVWEQGGTLRFEVSDDGAGMREGVARGHGFINMADRLGAVGGALTVGRSTEGGVLVQGQLPVPAAHS
jgi:signal transduction histidine kinase